MDNPKKTAAQIREQKKSDELFKIGDEMLKFAHENPFFSSAVLCEIFAEKHPERTKRAYDGILRTVKVFAPAGRHPEVGFTKHQALAEVSQRNVSRHLKVIFTLEQWQQAQAKALELIHQKEIKVNDLTERGEAKTLIEDCLKEILGQRF